MTAHYLDFACGDCGAKVGEPCHRALYPHSSRRDARTRARAAEIEPLPVGICTGCSAPQECREMGWCALRDDEEEPDHRDRALDSQGYSL